MGESIPAVLRSGADRRGTPVPAPCGPEHKSDQSFAWRRAAPASLPAGARPRGSPFSADLTNELLTGPDRETIAANRGKSLAARRPPVGPCRAFLPRWRPDNYL